jgi:hypothetical protein
MEMVANDAQKSVHNNSRSTTGARMAAMSVYAQG